MDAEKGEVTRLLKAMAHGDPQAADSLLPLIYTELHRLAKAYMRRERPDHTLQPTALINEAYMRLGVERETEWQDRTHFMASAAQAMLR